MKVELVRQDNETLGWDITPETMEERYILNHIRNLEFFCMGEDRIEYAGRKSEKIEVDGVEREFVSVLRYRKRKHNN